MSLLKIFDVSAYQGTTVPVADAVFVKATEGATYTSDKFKAQYASAKARAKHRGGYHFARPEASSAKSQCDRFLDVVQPVAGESLWLDLEASGLTQAKTHAWAVAWADRIRDQAPGITYGVYLGSGYATNGTGKGLAAEFPLWWYPQYPSAYQLAAGPGLEALRAMNRSSLISARTPIAATTTRWPPTVEPWLPSGLTFGRPRPEIWQFTDNLSGLDASVTALTLDQLAGSGGQQPEDDDMYAQAAGFPPPLRVGECHSHTNPKAKLNIWGFWFNSPHKLTYRISAHNSSGGGESGEVTVGGPNGTDAWPKKQTWTTKLATVDAFSIELVKAEGPTADWDPTKPGADGRTVYPGWDASHTA